MNVTIEDAFKEACTALGEGVVRERIQAVEIQRLTVASAHADPWTHLPNGRKATQVDTGQWVAADEGGWLAGARASAEDWLTDPEDYQP